MISTINKEEIKYRQRRQLLPRITLGLIELGHSCLLFINYVVRSRNEKKMKYKEKKKVLIIVLITNKYVYLVSPYIYGRPIVSIFGQTAVYRIYTVGREPIGLPEVQYPVFRV